LQPDLSIQVIAGGVCISVLVSAGSSASKVRGVHGGALKVAVRAAPEKGKANAEVEEVLADFFSVGKRSVSVISGQTSRNKQVQIVGIDLATARKKVEAL
jgi:uncharacterized protein